MNKKLLILFGVILLAAMLVGAGVFASIPSCANRVCTVRCVAKIANIPYCGGTPGNDVICGSNLRDVIEGLGGNDLVCGWYGNDEIYGGNGNDQLWGGPGNDYIDGGPGINAIDGGPGTDVCLKPPPPWAVNCP